MKKLYLILLSALVLCACSTADGRPKGSKNVQRLTEDMAVPEMKSSVPSQVVEYEGFTLSFNKQNGTPNWVAWALEPDETQGVESRKKYDFWQDEGVAGCPSKKDYTHSGFDRGHMCPAADQHWSMDAMRDCFSMANICPQNGELNRRAWGTLEKKCRQWSNEKGGLLITAGPVYEATDTETIAGGRVRVPGAFFKAIVAPNDAEPMGIAFVYPNAPAPGNMFKYAMSIDELEKIINMDLFPALDDSLETAVESGFKKGAWQ